MGNQGLCSKDTRLDSTFFNCQQQPQFRNSTAIQIVGQIPVVSGPPLNFNKQQTFQKVQKSSQEFCEINNLDDSLIPVISRIIAYGHTSIFKAYEQLPAQNQQTFLEQIRFVNFDFLDSLYHNYILHKKQLPERVVLPPYVINKSEISDFDKQSYYLEGKKIVEDKKVGFLIMCAGSSSRFIYQDKFLIPLDLHKNRSLLEIMLGRIRRNCHIRQGEIAKIPVIIACTEHNRMKIENFLKQRKYCGFQPNKFRFMTVYQIPVLDKNGKICLTFQYKIVQRPGGTAKCIQQMFNNPIYYNFFKNQKVQYLHIFGCQNIAQNPGDAFNFGYLYSNKLQLLGKCTDPEYPTECFPRYLGTMKGKKIILSGTQEILSSNLGQEHMEKILKKSPIAMNSIICHLQSLKIMIKNYENSMFLSQEFRTIERCENYFNYEKKRPQMNEPLIIFEKDIGHIMRCSQRCRLMRVSRDNFIPIISKNKQYAVKQSCQKFKIAQQRASCFSTQSRQSMSST